jgi:hypothetical protein
MPPDAITCPRCGATSHNPNDIAEGYCGRCHWWTSDAQLGAPDVIAAAEQAGAITHPWRPHHDDDRMDRFAPRSARDIPRE